MALTPFYYGSFNLNDGANFYLISKELAIPQINYITFPVARLPGVAKSGERLNEQTITLVVRVIGSSRSDLLNKIDLLGAAIMNRGQRLQIHDNDARYYIADCTDAKVKLDAGSVISASMTLTFTAYFPYAYGATNNTYTMVAQTLTVSSGVYYSTVQSITGGGNTTAYPVVTLTNTNNVTTTFVGLIGQTASGAVAACRTGSTPTIPGNAVVVIDCNPWDTNGTGYSFSVNGGAPFFFSGSFPVLLPTATNLQIQAQAGSAPAFSMLVQWTPLWAM